MRASYDILGQAQGGDEDVYPHIALAIASIASTAATVYTQDQTAKAQTRANQQQYDNTMTAMRFNLANANVTKQQEAENASQKIIENNAQARRDQSKATVAAGEAGLTRPGCCRKR